VGAGSPVNDGFDYLDDLFRDLPAPDTGLQFVVNRNYRSIG